MFNHHVHKHANVWCADCPSETKRCRFLCTNSHRLLQDIQLCDENLGFWQSQLSTGSNLQLLRLGLGPGQFVTDLATLLHLMPDAHHHARAEQLQQRVCVLCVRSTPFPVTGSSLYQCPCFFHQGPGWFIQSHCPEPSTHAQPCMPKYAQTVIIITPNVNQTQVGTAQ